MRAKKPLLLLEKHLTMAGAVLVESSWSSSLRYLAIENLKAWSVIVVLCCHCERKQSTIWIVEAQRIAQNSHRISAKVFTVSRTELRALFHERSISNLFRTLDRSRNLSNGIRGTKSKRTIGQSRVHSPG